MSRSSFNRLNTDCPCNCCELKGCGGLRNVCPDWSTYTEKTQKINRKIREASMLDSENRKKEKQ